MTKVFGHTIVRHSAFGYVKDPVFKQGLEVRSLLTKRQQERVLKEGGIIFSDFGDAIEYAYAEAYPEKYDGLVPAAPGRFSKHCIDGLAIYIPGEPS